ncbi:MAG: response regulator transcription factor [Myxococcota bacterium]
MDAPRRKVVLVEDDPDARDLLCALLGRMGFEVWPASDGRAGLSLVESHKPDLVCLDLSLPNISGFEVCQTIRGNVAHAGTRVLVTTARLSPQDRALAENLGVDEYLTKPFSTAAFKQAVERLLRESREPVALQPGAQT